VRLGLPAAAVVRLTVVVVVVYLEVVTLVPEAVGRANPLVLALYGLPFGLPRGLPLALCLIVLLGLGLAAPLLGLPAVLVVVVYRLVGLFAVEGFLVTLVPRRSSASA